MFSISNLELIGKYYRTINCHWIGQSEVIKSVWDSSVVITTYVKKYVGRRPLSEISGGLATLISHKALLCLALA